jgi:hypothetical protein
VLERIEDLDATISFFVQDRRKFPVSQANKVFFSTALSQPGSTFARSLSSRASSAVASHSTRTIFAICSRGRLAAKRAMNSPSHFAGRITARATSKPGGKQPALILSRSPASYGSTPAQGRGDLSLGWRHLELPVLNWSQDLKSPSRLAKGQPADSRHVHREGSGTSQQVRT